MIRLGYPTQNLTIGASTNRSLRLRNLPAAEKVRSLVRKNLRDLRRILRWNARRGIGLFRLGQSVIPFAPHPGFPYDWEVGHAAKLREAPDLTLPAWRVRPKVHLSSQDPEKQPGAHARLVRLEDWLGLLEALDGREADVMVEAKGKELALEPLLPSGGPLERREDARKPAAGGDPRPAPERPQHRGGRALG
jgi:UV DNA damage repair endonuclease